VGKLATMPLCLIKQRLLSQKFVCHAAMRGFVFITEKCFIVHFALQKHQF
jgi:hypothetical protein